VHQSTHEAAPHSLVNFQVSAAAKPVATSTGSAWALDKNKTYGGRFPRRETILAKPKKQ
jgi:hypothetical protein